MVLKKSTIKVLIYNHGSQIFWKKNQIPGLELPVFDGSFMKPGGSLKFLNYPKPAKFF
jgi:hypothetical protein